MDQQVVMMLLAVLAPLVTGLATLMLPRGAVTGRVLTALSGPVLSAGLLLTLGVRAAPAGVPFAPTLNLELTFLTDGLGLFFGLLVSGIGALIVLYARGYFGRDVAALGRFYPTLGLFATAMLGLVLSDNFLGMFLFWELTSVSSFLLIGWHRSDRRSVRLALQAFATTGLGGMALLGGLIVLGVGTGVWSFSELASQPGGALAGADRGLVTAAFALLFVGAAAKSAQWPLHFWLPGAMAAPTPVSAYLHSATMVKAGVYVLGRLMPTLGEVAWWTPTLVAFGSATMVVGGYLALRSNALKKIFAYTTVSQLGLLTCMYGLGALEFVGKGEPGAAQANAVWPVLQILNHALYKAPLFIIAGAIIHATGRKLLSEQRGLWRRHRGLALIAMLAAYAMAGLPLTLSFTAKEAFLYQVWHAIESPGGGVWFWSVAVCAVFMAMCNVAIFVRIVRTFVGRAEAAPGHGHDDAHESERGFWGACIWWPAAAIVVWQFVGGVAPGLIEPALRAVETHALYWEHVPGPVHAVTHAGVPLALSGVAIVCGAALGLSGMWRTPVDDAHDRLFPSVFRAGEVVGFGVFRGVQSGDLRVYVATVLMVFVLGVGGAMMSVGGELLAWPEVPSFVPGGAELAISGVAATGLICFTAVAIPFLRQRVHRVIVLGACGFSVTAMYLLYRAPDLALTQLMFESISVVLFMLALRLLPERTAKLPRPLVVPRIVLALIVGGLVGWLVLHAGAEADRSALLAYERSAAQEVATESADGDAALASVIGVADRGEAESDVAIAGDAHPRPEVRAADETRLGGWFLERSYKGPSGERGGGGNNVVNVILVDFRGYDTLGEITVLAIAMMGVLALLAAATPARSVRGRSADGVVMEHQPHLSSPMLRTGVRLILPLSLLLAAYVFFKGHQEPGGGFIAGLIASVGLAAYRMATGVEALKRLLPIKPGVTAAIGLSIALATAAAPLLFGVATSGEPLPILTSNHSYLPLPGGGEYHWTSVVLFDLGVFIVVVGVSVGMINRFEEELDR